MSSTVSARIRVHLSIYLHPAVPLSPPALQSLYLEYMDSCVMALRCGLPLGVLSLLLPAAPASSRSPSFQNALLARAILNAARSRPIPTRDLPLHPPFPPPHLGPLSIKPVPICACLAPSNQKDSNHASPRSCWEETTKKEDDRCPMTNAARRFSAAHHLPALPGLHASLFLESI